MKIQTNHVGLGLFLAIGLLSCDRTPITGSPEENITYKQGTPSDQITWVSWKQDVVDQIKDRRLLKKGTKSKRIKAHKGGKVGGGDTFDNKVEIPAGALAEDTYITVDVIFVDGKKQTGAGVDFLPSMQFLKDVKVTLSWKFLDYDGDDDEDDDKDDDKDDDSNDDLDFIVYFSQDSGSTWFEVENPDIDYDKRTVSIYVDHFTRFAWGL